MFNAKMYEVVGPEHDGFTPRDRFNHFVEAVRFGVGEYDDPEDFAIMVFDLDKGTDGYVLQSVQRLRLDITRVF